MGFSGDFCSSRDRERDTEKEEEDALLTTPSSAPQTKIPKDSFHFAYIVYFTLGTGYLLPWNAFITAVDYFAFLYPGASVDRVFAVVYMLVGLLFLVGVVGWAHKSSAFLRINLGLLMFVISLSIVPILDLVYVKGRPGLYSGYYVTVAAVAMAAVADALVQSSVIGSAGELPERYMQATVAGTAASGMELLLLLLLLCCG